MFTRSEGPSERGLVRTRIAHGVSVRYGGRFSADTVIVTLVEEVGLAEGGRPGAAAAAADALLVITDDRGLRYAVGRRGARESQSAEHAQDRLAAEVAFVVYGSIAVLAAVGGLELETESLKAPEAAAVRPAGKSATLANLSETHRKLRKYGRRRALCSSARAPADAG